MLTEQPANLQYTQLLDALPDAVYWMRALRDGDNQVLDFQVDYVNQMAQEITQGVYQILVGTTVLGTNRHDRPAMERSFGELCEVLVTGQPQERTYFNPTLKGWFLSHRTRLGDGVLSVIRNVTSLKTVEQTSEQQARLLGGILEASLNGIITYEAIRDAGGTIADFRFVQFNDAARRMLGLTDDTVGKPMLDELPGVKEGGLFTKFVQVVETGQPTRFETPFPAGDQLLWYDMSVVKLGDGFVITFNDITISKRATLETERQRTLLNGILDASQDSIWVLEAIRDENGAIINFRPTHANQPAATLLGYSVTELLGALLLELYPGMKQTGLFDAYCRVVNTGQPYQDEILYDQDGLSGWFEVSAVKLDDGFALTFKDIGDRKRVAFRIEQVADENKRQATFLHSVLDSSSNGIVAERAIRDADGNITDFLILSANQQAAELVRSTVEQLVGYGDLELHPNLHESGIFDAYCRTVDTGEPQFVQLYYQDGRLSYWVNINTRKLDDDELVITFSDITQIKRAQQALEQAADENKRQAALMQTMLDGALNGVLLLEPVYDPAQGAVVDFKILAANQAVERLTGARPADAIGQTMLAVYPGYKQGGFFSLYCNVLASGEPQGKEFYYEDETLVGWFEVSVVKQGDGLVLTFASTTQVRQAQLAIEQAAGENKRQADLLNSVLNSSPSGIKALKAVRNEAGEIVDFVISVINRAGAAVRGLVAGEMVGQGLLQAFPGVCESGLFDQYVRVVQTGEAQHLQSFYGDAWYDMTLSPFDDGVVVTYTDVSESRGAQQALAQAAADLQAVIDSSQTGIFVFSPVYDAAGRHVDFRFKTINRMVAALVGQTPDVIRGKVASDWFVSYRETGLFDRYKVTFDTGIEQRFDIHYAVDGFDVWFDVHSVKFGANVLVTFTDYTDLKQAQLAVERQAADTRRQAELVKSVLDSSPSGIMSFEAVRDGGGGIVDFRIVTVNQASEQITGLPVDALIGNTLLTVFPGNVDSGLFAMYVQTTETGESTHTETYYNYDGLDFWLDISARKLGDGLVVTFSDISFVKRAAQVVEQSAVQLQTVIDTAQTGIFLFSPIRDETGDVVDFRFRLANRQLAAYVGQTPDAVNGALGSTWFPDYKSNGLFDAYRKTYLTGEPQRFDFHYDGSGIDVWLDIMSTKTGDDVVVTFGDYTPLKKLQQQLEVSVVDLQRSNKNLEQFAYVASHDLQEPLRKIQAFGDIIQTNYAPVIGTEGADMIGRMQSAAARMQVLIRDVLAYSRIATKRDVTTPVDLNQLVDDVLTDLERAIGDKQASVRVDALPTVNGDALQLRQLFQNLIGNALKFNRPHQPVVVSVSSRPVRGADVPNGVVSPGDANRLFHQIDVADNGIGFEPHHAERIFQVFQRLHGRSNYEGTGIGLAIVLKVVQNHQGYIVAEGRPGEGAVFQILLPV